jgi:hypothetical protein
LGHPLDCQSTILRQQVHAFEAIPALVAIIMASLYVLDYCAHSYLLLPPFAFVCVMVKDGEVAFWLQPFVVSSHYLPGAVIEFGLRNPPQYKRFRHKYRKFRYS